MPRKSKTIEIPYAYGLKYEIPEPEKETDIINYDVKNKKDQFWQRPPMPNFRMLSTDEKDAFFLNELKRSTQGAHFLNNGKLEYLAPVHYWFLNHWDLGGGRYPDFYKWHQYLGWFMHKCRTDENCFGGIVLTSKRAGKSEYIPCEFQVDAMTQVKAEYIMQAQNDIKAKKLFRRSTAAFYSLKRSLPYLYNYYTTKSEIMFKNASEQKKTSAKASVKEVEEDFAVSDHVAIGAYPSKIDFVQGEATRGYFLDEFCSQELMDLQELHLKVLAQCSKGIGLKIIGKSWWVATPENAESKALEYSEQMFKDSDITRLDRNGRTASGLYRMLVPYYASTPDFIDKYGYANEEAAKEFFQNKCEGKTPQVINTLRRQYIASEEDAFLPVGDEQLEADVLQVLKQMINELAGKPQPKYTITKFKGEIIVNPASNSELDGQFTFEMFEPPQEHHKYRAGLDATSTAKNSTNKNSKGQEAGDAKSEFSLVIHKITGDNQYVDVANYVVRPEKRHLVEKAALWICVYYNKYGGLRVYPERNASAGSTLTDLFESEGQQKMLIRQLKYHNTDKLIEKTGGAYGIYIDANNKDYRTSVMNKYLRLYGHKINSLRIVKNLLIYGRKNADLSDAYGVGAMACGNFEPEKKEKVYADKPKNKVRRFEMVNGKLQQVWVDA